MIGGLLGVVPPGRQSYFQHHFLHSATVDQSTDIRCEPRHCIDPNDLICT